MGRASVVAPLVCEQREEQRSRSSSRTSKQRVGKKKRKLEHSNPAPLPPQEASPIKHSLIEVRT